MGFSGTFPRNLASPTTPVSMAHGLESLLLLRLSSGHLLPPTAALSCGNPELPNRDCRIDEGPDCCERPDAARTILRIRTKFRSGQLAGLGLLDLHDSRPLFVGGDAWNLEPRLGSAIYSQCWALFPCVEPPGAFLF